MSIANTVKIEGLTIDEIISLPEEMLEALAFGEPIVVNIGSASVLGKFTLLAGRLIVELAHIDGGGEGVLQSLWLLARRYARKKDLKEIEWVVHAVECQRPNLKLRRVLDKRGFVVEEVEGKGRAYHFIDRLKE
ncbi:MAG: hypothetical protein H7Y37_08955 [Anaerolineae bacterium]|nr:hypothetical protein [Gloeobacterales cyanobacterium ES-bin-313]